MTIAMPMKARLNDVVGQGLRYIHFAQYGLNDDPMKSQCLYHKNKFVFIMS